MKLEDLSGKKYNKLYVIKYVGKSKWLCKCECGKNCIVIASKLKNGHTKSCGCLQKEMTHKANSKHNECGSRLYCEWLNMKSRCNNKNNKYYKIYGGRGITICDEWSKNYLKFKEWAIANGYQDNLTIDRIDNNGNYEPTNCRWATWKEQANNTRRTIKYEFGNLKLSIKQWAELFGINYGTFKDRINKRKWDFYKCLGFATEQEAQAKLKEIQGNE